MKAILIAVGAVVVVSGVAFAGEHAGKAMESKPADAKMAMTPGVFSAGKMTWMSIGDPKNGPWISVVQGNPQEGPNTVYLKVKASTDSSWHTHDSDYSGVVIAGDFSHQDQGGAVLKPKVGEAWTSKAGVNHLNKCAGKKDCVLFIAMTGKSSFNSMTADGKPVTMPAAAATPAMKTN